MRTSRVILQNRSTTAWQAHDRAGCADSYLNILGWHMPWSGCRGGGRRGSRGGRSCSRLSAGRGRGSARASLAGRHGVVLAKEGAVVILAVDLS